MFEASQDSMFPRGLLGERGGKAQGVTLGSHATLRGGSRHFLPTKKLVENTVMGLRTGMYVYVQYVQYVCLSVLLRKWTYLDDCTTWLENEMRWTRGGKVLNETAEQERRLRSTDMRPFDGAPPQVEMEDGEAVWLR